MSGEQYFLRPNVLAEPVVHHWNAYDQLVFPPSLAMVARNSHLPLMRSYIADPAYHRQASHEPSLVGGPWMNFETPRIDEVKALLADTERRMARQLELAAAIKQLDELLRREAKGASLEPLYARIPEPLRGYVELVYDLNHHPSIRFIEGLFYRSPAYDTGLQGFWLSRIDRDQRPFQWSTPVLPQPRRLYVERPFAAAEVDALFASKTRGSSRSELLELLGGGAQAEALFDSFFTCEPSPSRHRRPEGSEVRVRYFGHACVLIESREMSILVDPFVSYDYPAELARFTYRDLPEHLDFVLLTHAHNDHTELETLLQLRHKIGTVLAPRTSGSKLQDPSLRLLLETIGFPRVRELHELESVPCPGGEVTALPFLGEHCDLDIQSKRGFLVQLEGKSVLCAADSRNVEPQLYSHLARLFGKLDVLFLGMECDGAPMSWGYGKLFTQAIDRKLDQSRTFSGSDCEQGLSLVDALKPSQVYIYAMGEEPWVDHVMVIPHDPASKRSVEPTRFIAACRERGLLAEKLFGSKDLHLP